MNKFSKNIPYPFFCFILLFLSALLYVFSAVDFIPGTPALEKEREYHIDYIKNPVSDISYSLSSETCRLDIIAPQKHDKLLPVIIYYHGGGWIGGERQSYTDFCQRVADKGFLVVNVDYRLLPEADFPAFLQDAQDAYFWVNQHIASYGGDSANIFLCGDSAGAHISALCANSLTNPYFTDKCGTRNASLDNIRGLGLLCGVYDIELMGEIPGARSMTESLIGKSKIENVEENLEILTVTGHIGKDYPPCFITTCYYDPLNNQVEPFIKDLVKFDIGFDLLFYDASHTKLGHCYQVAESEESEECITRMTDFFLSCCV